MALETLSVVYATDHRAMGGYKCGHCDSVDGSAMISRPSDDKIEMEQRRIREVELRVVTQEEIVVRLDLMGAYELALTAREPLVRFCIFLAFARKRLDYLERKRSGNAPESQG